MKIKYNSEILSACTDEEFLYYLLTVPYCGRSSGNYITNDIVATSAYKTFNINTRQKSTCDDRISSLLIKGVLNGEKIDKGKYIIRKPDSESWQYYSYIDEDLIDKILNSNCRNKPALIRVLCAVLISRDAKTKYKICHMPLSYFTSSLHKSKTTIITCLDTLVALNILDKTTRGKHQTTLYSLLEDSKREEPGPDKGIDDSSPF